MTDKPTAPLSLGLDISRQEIQVVLLKARKNIISIERIIVIPIEHDESNHVKPLYTEKQKKQFSSILKKSLIVTGLPSSEVMVRSLTVQLTKEKDIDQVLEFQSEPLLPFSIEEAIIDKMIARKGLDHTELTVCAVKKELLSEHINLWHEAGVEPEVITSSQAALSTFSKYFSQIEGLHYLLYLGDEETICLLVNEGVLLNAQVARVGVKELHNGFSSDTGLQDKNLEQSLATCDLNTVTSTTHPQLHQAIERLKIEVTKHFFSLAKQFPGQEIKNVLITGIGSSLLHLPQIINNSINKTLHFPNQLKGFNLTPLELQRLSIPLGLALMAIPKAQNQINFRQKEYTYPDPWKRIKRPMAIYLSLCIILAASILTFGNVYIDKNEDSLHKKYLDIITIMNKPFAEIEAEVKKKNPNAKTFGEGSSHSIKKMSQKELAYRVSMLEKKIEEAPDTFPLLPNTPKVTDFLAWLSTHPHILSSGNTQEKKIILESLNYKMVKRPDANKKKERYQIKVELEFSTSTPRFAREFHDILLAPNEMIDPNEDVKWNAERGRYRTSFYLKDRTKYPTEKRR